MEPMALGSPVGSPSGTPSSPTTSPFLPSFLMGDSAPNVSSPRSTNQARQQTPRHVTFGAISSLAAMPSSHSLLPNQVGNSRPLQSVTSPAEKPTSDFGPPTMGLFDTLSPLPGSAVSSHKVSNSALHLSFSGILSDVSHSNQTAVMTSPSASVGPSNFPEEALLYGSEGQKPAGVLAGSRESGVLAGSESAREADTWVTVFGFLPHAINDILAHFVHCGCILEHRWGGGCLSGDAVIKCNWVHLRFRSAREARRALGKNGKVFGGCMMVGVVPCQDVEILHTQKENIQGPEVNFPSRSADQGALSGIRPLAVDFTSPWKESPKTRSSSGGNSGIRPLMKTVSSPQSDEVQSEGNSAKSSGLLSKTIDFLFGQ